MESALMGSAFNWMTVLVLLPIEVASHMLLKLTGAIVDPIAQDNATSIEKIFNPIAFICDPLQDLFLVIDKQGLGELDYNGTFVQERMIIKILKTRDCVDIS